MERRQARNRRQVAGPEEPLERKSRDRRAEDRRDWARTVRTITVIEGDGTRGRHLADVSVDGVQYVTPATIATQDVEVRLSDELVLPGRIIRMRAVGRAMAVHVRFASVDVRRQLALARLLDRDTRA